MFCANKFSFHICPSVPLYTSMWPDFFRVTMLWRHHPLTCNRLKVWRCILSFIEVLREGRWGGAKELYITSGLIVEFGMMCTDGEDIEELTGMSSPLCWQGYDKDLCGFKKLMWYVIVKELNCKASSTWSLYGRESENAFTHRHLSPEKKRQKQWTGWKPETDG